MDLRTPTLTFSSLLRFDLFVIEPSSATDD
jgi:hypothetical protein